MDQSKRPKAWVDGVGPEVSAEPYSVQRETKQTGPDRDQCTLTVWAPGAAGVFTAKTTAMNEDQAKEFAKKLVAFLVNGSRISIEIVERTTWEVVS